jgi:hypothetical protein
MKRFKILLMAVLLSGTGFFAAQAQEKPREQRDEELERAIIEQKKALNEQKRAQERANEELRQSMKELEKLKGMDLDFDVDVDETGNNVRIYRRGRSLMPENFYIPSAPNAPNPPMIHFFGDGGGAGTSWELSRNVKESSFKKEYEFEVDKSAKSVSMGVSGDCKSGEIRIKVITPNGKTYTDVVIDEFGNFNVRKSFTITETENQDKTGDWQFLVDSNNATGYFRISIQTY